MDPSPAEFKKLQDRYGFLPTHGVQIPVAGSVMNLPPVGKVGIPLKVFDAGFRLPITIFQRDVLAHYGASIQFLSPNAINKMVGFEMLCRSLGFLPDIYLFKHFFKFSSSGRLFNFSCRPEVTSIMIGLLPLRGTWSDKWLWVNSHLVSGGGYLRHHREPDTAPTLHGESKKQAEKLAKHGVVVNEWPESILAGVGMSALWRSRGEMPVFSAVRADGMSRFLRISFLFLLSSLFYSAIYFARWRFAAVDDPGAVHIVSWRIAA